MSLFLLVLCSTIPNNLETIWIERIISFQAINYENFTFATSAWTSSASLNCLLISPGEKTKKQKLSNIQCTCRFKALFTQRRRNLNKASFLQLGLPSTLIRHKNGAFRKRSSNRRNLKTTTLRYSVDWKHFENWAFWKRRRQDSHVISMTEFSSNTNPKWPVIVGF